MVRDPICGRASESLSASAGTPLTPRSARAMPRKPLAADSTRDTGSPVPCAERASIAVRPRVAPSLARLARKPRALLRAVHLDRRSDRHAHRLHKRAWPLSDSEATGCTAGGSDKPRPSNSRTIDTCTPSSARGNHPSGTRTSQPGQRLRMVSQRVVPRAAVGRPKGRPGAVSIGCPECHHPGCESAIVQSRDPGAVFAGCCLIPRSSDCALRSFRRY